MVSLRTWIAVAVFAGLAVQVAAAPENQETLMLIDNFSGPTCTLGTRWTAVSDRVMGGVSDVAATRESGERAHIRLTGQVRNVPGAGSPGFVQIGLDLGGLDASAFTGVRLVVRGDGKSYGVHLRTPDVRRPWQSYRGRFVASETWTEVRIAFSEFAPYRIAEPLDRSQLRRLSIIAVDRLGEADVRIAEVGLY